MLEYTICSEANDDIFRKQCAALEKHIPGLLKEDILTDVDGSQIQYYSFNGSEIKVYNDYYEGGVYIKSAIPLEPFFKS